MSNQKSSSNRIVARLALEDGSVFSGQAFGDTSPKSVEGEVCFNTSLTGYQEILTDPSYTGQIVTMTYTQIGNYGLNSDDMESKDSTVRGFVIKELTNLVSNYRSEQDLSQWLAERNILGITGIDTRALTRKLRTQGALKGVISTDSNFSDVELVQKAKNSEGLEGRNLVAEVSCKEAMGWTEGLGKWLPIQGEVAKSEGFHVVAIDCGAKLNILRNLVDQGVKVTVVPFDTSAADILSYKPDGLFVSNGPGDPSAVTETIETLKG